MPDAVFVDPEKSEELYAALLRLGEALLAFGEKAAGLAFLAEAPGESPDGTQEPPGTRQQAEGLMAQTGAGFNRAVALLNQAVEGLSLPFPSGGPVSGEEARTASPAVSGDLPAQVTPTPAPGWFRRTLNRAGDLLTLSNHLEEDLLTMENFNVQSAPANGFEFFPEFTAPEDAGEPAALLEHLATLLQQGLDRLEQMPGASTGESMGDAPLWTPERIAPEPAQVLHPAGGTVNHSNVETHIGEINITSAAVDGKELVEEISGRVKAAVKVNACAAATL